MKKLKKAKSRATGRNDEAEKLADLHIRLCPAAKAEHRKGLVTKCLALLKKYSLEHIGVVIEDCSRRAIQGDGWGVILACMPFAESKLREKSLNENVERDRRELPKEPARGKSQPVLLPNEWSTGQEVNRQVRALIMAEKENCKIFGK